MEDLQEVWASVEAERERIRPWMPWVDLVPTIDDEGRWFERIVASEDNFEGCGIFVDGEFAGSVGLGTSDPFGVSGELGYWVKAAHEGRGLVTRACEALVRVGFEEIGLHRIQLHAVPENTRSRGVAERLGMRLEGTSRQAAKTSLGYVDLVVYAMLEDEWRARR